MGVYPRPMEPLTFTKMHGLGNDFVVVDGRTLDHPITPDQARAIADRRRGIGCDQLLVLESPEDDLADVFMRIRNPDGGEAGACGNGTRCVAALVMNQNKTDHLVVQTVAGLLDAEVHTNGLVSVDMGRAGLDWREIPLSKAVDTLRIPIEVGPLKEPVGVSMGNPHAVFVVDDADKIALETFGPVLEKHEMFPEFANIEVISKNPDHSLRMRVWERGAGITQACGSGACATIVAAVRRGLIPGRKADVHLDGGTLHMEWLPDGNVMMTGPVATSFVGTIHPSLLETPN